MELHILKSLREITGDISRLTQENLRIYAITEASECGRGVFSTQKGVAQSLGLAAHALASNSCSIIGSGMGGKKVHAAVEPFEVQGKNSRLMVTLI